MKKSEMTNKNYFEALRLLKEAGLHPFDDKIKGGRSLKIWGGVWGSVRVEPELVEKLTKLADKTWGGNSDKHPDVRYWFLEK